MTQPLHLLLFAFLALLALFACAEPALAGFSDITSSLARRDRVIQVCVIVACLALFILMKKFGPDDR